MEYLTTVEVSAYIKRSPGAVRNLVLRRKIPYRRPAGRLLFIRGEIDEWVKQAEGISQKELIEKNG
jgi:hypothetical protein